MLLPLARMTFWTCLVLLLLKARWREASIGAGVELGLLLPVTMAALKKLQAGAITWLALPLEWLFLLSIRSVRRRRIIVKPKRWK